MKREESEREMRGRREERKEKVNEMKEGGRKIVYFFLMDWDFSC